MVLQSDPARARDLLGWEATTSLEAGLGRTIEWLRSHPIAHGPSGLQL
jgi:nucleoside-diphosphate-sugar epimerase